MIIRRAKIEDVEEIFSIRNSTDERIEKSSILDEIINPNYLVLVAEENGEIAGFLSVIKNYDCADVMMIATGLSYRRNGVATKLLSEAIEMLKNLGVNRLLLEVNETNIGAIELYKKLRFKQISIRKKYYKGQFDALIMERFI